MLKFTVLILCFFVEASPQVCSENVLLEYLKISTYDFSVRLLDRVAQETGGNFVYSPISTWLQLLALSDGARGETLNEILNVTRQNTICSKRVVKQFINSLDKELSDTIKHQSDFFIDKLLKVKESFVNSVEELNAAKFHKVSFNKKYANLNENIIDDVGLTSDLLYYDDFRLKTFLITDVATLQVNWKSPFNPVYTQVEPFYGNDKVKIGHVNMMSQIGYFKFIYISQINAQAMELPFNDRTSLILLRAVKGNAEDLFFKMKDTSISSISGYFDVNEPRLLNLKMPRFNLTTDINNIPELLDDMGLRRMFSPNRAELKDISDYTVYVSLMVNNFNIKVNERGISAWVAPESIIKEKYSMHVYFNKPFVFLLIDKISNIILFGGIYSKPELF